MRRAARVDANHVEIVSAFRKLGCSVLSLAGIGKGVPDLLVAVQGITWLVEVKSGKGKENDDQIEWAENWKGARALVRDTEGVETVVKLMRLSDKNGHG
jgi:Holliday junction resolvase